MKIKIEWPDGSGHHYSTDHAGVQRLANFISQMYVMGELELVDTLAMSSEGAGVSQYATGREDSNSEDIFDNAEQIDLEEAIKDMDNGC